MQQEAVESLGIKGTVPMTSAGWPMATAGPDQIDTRSNRSLCHVIKRGSGRVRNQSA